MYLLYTVYVLKEDAYNYRKTMISMKEKNYNVVVDFLQIKSHIS